MEKAIQELKTDAGMQRKETVAYGIMEFLFTVTGTFATEQLFANKSMQTPLIISGVIVFDLICIFLLGMKLWKRKHAPTILAEYFDASHQLDKQKTVNRRNETINRFIDKSIMSLNANTCIADKGENNLCDNPLIEGIKQVLEPFVKFPFDIFNTSERKFTVAVWFNGIYEIVDEPIPHLANPEEVFILRDDYVLENDIVDCMECKSDCQEHKLKIYTQGNCSYKDSKLENHIIEFKEKENLRLVTAPIPAVCEGINYGIIFIFCNESVNVPDDLDNALQIFNRITTNWISKHEQCLVKKLQRILDDITERQRQNVKINTVFLPDEVKGKLSSGLSKDVSSDNKIAG